jgi:hypothetical protein
MIERIEYEAPLESVDDEFARRFSALRPDDVAGHFALAEWLAEKKRFDLVRKQCNYVLGLDPKHANAQLLLAMAQQHLSESTEPATAPADDGDESRARGLPAPPMLSDRDIKRLKLLELELDGPPEKLRVRFLKKKNELDVERLVQADMRMLPEFRGSSPDWIDIMERGEPHEKLQLIAKTTGAKYVDRIEIVGDPAVFSTFRRDIMPLINKGCARSGCHTGAKSLALRFPTGSPGSEEHLYTTFYLLDQFETAQGPLINRGLTTASTLLTFMLPASQTKRPHPPTPRGERVQPILRGDDDPKYQPILDWLNSLRTPHPDYGLEYNLPDWVKLPPPPETQPASAPADGDGAGKPTPGRP